MARSREVTGPSPGVVGPKPSSVTSLYALYERGVFVDRVGQPLAVIANTALVKRVKALEDQLSSLTKENERLKKGADSKRYENEKKFEKAVNEKKNEKIMGYVPMRQGSLFDNEATRNKLNNK